MRGVAPRRKEIQSRKVLTPVAGNSTDVTEGIYEEWLAASPRGTNG
jgi:hypothetical protein